MQQRSSRSGFTLIETMVAITILMIAVIAPMTLTVRALQSAFYARDQIVASNLAQEAIESIRSVRDGNVLINAFGGSVNLLEGIPDTTGQSFRIDAQDNAMVLCSTDPGGQCIPLQTNGEIFGYGSGWAPTRFYRTVTAQFVNGNPDEVRIAVTVRWQTGRFQERSFTISENLYRWIEDGSAAATP
ncbi:prepilin-type N-terminal cleavage/methylation domain-containing protein [Candidatus Kaiserbacteria bacterium]|nr:prepilin-type N-terminal cleavage/methylation domain-containing protein [Candidatus Kaiserbacteria bacterium]